MIPSTLKIIHLPKFTSLWSSNYRIILFNSDSTFIISKTYWSERTSRLLVCHFSSQDVNKPVPIHGSRNLYTDDFFRCLQHRSKISIDCRWQTTVRQDQSTTNFSTSYNFILACFLYWTFLSLLIFLYFCLEKKLMLDTSEDTFLEDGVPQLDAGNNFIESVM